MGIAKQNEGQDSQHRPNNLVQKNITNK